MKPAVAALLVLAVSGVAGTGLWIALAPEPEPVAPPDRRPTTPVAGTAPRARDPDPGVPMGPIQPVAKADPFASEPPIPAEESTEIPGAGLHYSFGPWGGAAGQVDWKRVAIECRKARRVFLTAVWAMEREAADPMLARMNIGTAQARILQHLEPVIRPLHEVRMDPENPPPMEVLAQPVIEANLIAATLDAWALPLSRDQDRKVGELFSAYSERWNELRDSGPGVWPLESLVAATWARRELQTELEALLEPAQRTALWPAELRGRVHLDMYSAANLWRERLMPLEVPERGDRREPFIERLLHSFQVDPGARPMVAEAVAVWIAARKTDLLAGVRGPVSRAGYFAESEWYPLVDAWPDLAKEVEARIKRLPPEPPKPVPKWLDHSLPGQKPPAPPPVIPVGRRIPVPIPTRR